MSRTVFSLRKSALSFKSGCQITVPSNLEMQVWVPDLFFYLPPLLGPGAAQISFASLNVVPTQRWPRLPDG